MAIMMDTEKQAASSMAYIAISQSIAAILGGRLRNSTSSSSQRYYFTLGISPILKSLKTALFMAGVF